jgi:RNA polymerase sigma factor (sigma-70 family)
MEKIEDWYPLIAKIARKYTKMHPVEDSEEYAECCLAFVRATAGFDPSKATWMTYLYKSLENACWSWRSHVDKLKTLKHDFAKETKDIFLAETNEDIFHKAEIDKYLSVLDDRSAYILTEMAKGRTLKEVGDELGLTRERIRQIKNEAIKKIQRKFGIVKGKS